MKLVSTGILKVRLRVFSVCLLIVVMVWRAESGTWTVGTASALPLAAVVEAAEVVLLAAGVAGAVVAAAAVAVTWATVAAAVVAAAVGPLVTATVVGAT